MLSITTTPTDNIFSRLLRALRALVGFEPATGWAIICVHEPAGGHSASQTPLSPRAAWYLYLERIGRGRAWDPPDVRILREAAAPQARSTRVAFRAVDGVANYRQTRRGIVVREVLDDFGPVEETLALDGRWRGRATTPDAPPP